MICSAQNGHSLVSLIDDLAHEGFAVRYVWRSRFNRVPRYRRTSITHARKSTKRRDRIAALTLQLKSAHRQRGERVDMAQKVFELSQSLTERWLAADYAAKRQILEMVCLNFTLDGATLVPQMRKPFDILVEGLFSLIKSG